MYGVINTALPTLHANHTHLTGPWAGTGSTQEEMFSPGPCGILDILPSPDKTGQARYTEQTVQSD